LCQASVHHSADDDQEKFWYSVVRGGGDAGMMLRSITFIKFVHTVVFVFLSGALAVFLYEVSVDKITFLTWIAVALFLAEGVVLIANGWKCPLTTYVERLGSTHGQVTDIFLPKWFADRIFHIYRGLLAVALVLLAIRMLD
jgi:hypothetical protein